MEITSAPLRGRKNAIRQVVEVIRDQTEQHKRDEENVTIAQQVATQDYLFQRRVADYRELQGAYKPLSKAIAKLVSIVPRSPQVT